MAAAPGTSVLAFLEAATVSTVFRVVPVEVAENYLISIQTDFETFVPSPLIDWEPKVLDMGRIINGEITEVTVVATNYGLIASTTTEITWPKTMGRFSFIFPEGGQQLPVDDDRLQMYDYGALPANSSISVTIQIERDPITYRRSLIAPLVAVPLGISK